jgi:flagellar motor switch protein FliM
MATEEKKPTPEEEAALASMMQEMAQAQSTPLGPDGLPLTEGSTLSQDEIDSLLGFGEKVEIPNKGVDAILFRARDNYEKFPMLEVVFDRFARSVSTSLRSFTGENAEVTAENITSIRFEDYLNSIPLPAMISIFQATEWENVGLMTIDSALIYSLVDILLGGGKADGVFRVEGRPFTTIEQDIIKNFSRLILEEITSAFTPITTVSFRMDRLETNPRFATITRPSSPVVIISCRIEFDGVGGKIDVVFPYATLEPVKELLSQMFSGETFGADISWEGFLSEEIKASNVKIRAELDKKILTLKELASIKVGSTITMENAPEDDIKLTCNKVVLLKGKLGSVEENMAISITGGSFLNQE